MKNSSKDNQTLFEKYVGRSIFRFSLLVIALGILFFSFIWLYLLLHPHPKKVSSVIYTVSSKVQPIYTDAEEGEKTFNKVIADAKYYTTEPTNQDKASHLLTGTPYVSEDAGSLYYKMKTPPYLVDFLKDFFDSPTSYRLIFYDTEHNSYKVKETSSLTVKEDKRSQYDIDSYYRKHYGGYKGTPAPVFSYTPKVEIITYIDDSVEWVYSEDWKIENEDELKDYIKSSPKKED